MAPNFIMMSTLFVSDEHPLTDPSAKRKVESPDLQRLSGKITTIVIEKGTQSGAPSVALLLEDQDGKPYIVETTAKLFVSTANMIKAKYPDLLD